MRADQAGLSASRASQPASQPKLVQLFGLRATGRRAAAGDGVVGSDAAVPWRNCSPHQIDPNASNGKGEGRGRKPTEASEDADEERRQTGEKKKEGEALRGHRAKKAAGPARGRSPVQPVL